MASITIRRLDDVVKERLRVRAAQHGCSMAEEARAILRQALLAEPPPEPNLAEVIRGRFAALGGVELTVPPSDWVRDPIEWSE